jgi:hypothetical protein
MYRVKIYITLNSKTLPLNIDIYKKLYRMYSLIVGLMLSFSKPHRLLDSFLDYRLTLILWFRARSLEVFTACFLKRKYNSAAPAKHQMKEYVMMIMKVSIKDDSVKEESLFHDVRNLT